MNTVPFYDLKITDGFWAERQKTLRETTLWAIYDRFVETGRVETMDCQVHGIKPHCFWGSDVFKWMEGAAYLLKEQDDPAIRKAVDEILTMVEAGMLEDGYYNSYYNNPEIEEPRFTDRNMHELYSMGHMFEAAVALHEIGDDRLLTLSCRAADLVYRIFLEEDSAAFVTPGHEEIELALVRLYRVTGNEKYLELASFFVEKRGNNPKDKPLADPIDFRVQGHLPVRRQTEAVGHAVRAMYLYSAMVDLAAERQDESLWAAANRLFEDVCHRKMYISGGVGALASGECFSLPYHLQNASAYSETCATLGFALFCRRLYGQVPDSRYGDAAERALFNGMIAGLSLKGDSFFYNDPLEIDLSRQNIPLETRHLVTQRKKVFETSCCPPNLVRLIPSVADFLYTYDENTLYVHQYMANEGTAAGAKIRMETKYPESGKVKIAFSGTQKLALRRPGWCSCVKTGAAYREEKGYLYFDTNEVDIEFVMEPVFYAAAGQVHENAGRVALMRGPILYCVEEQDQVCPIHSLKADISAPVTVLEESFGGYPLLEGKGVYIPAQTALYAPAQQAETPCTIRFIPYYTFANRGEDSMMVWLLRK